MNDILANVSDVEFVEQAYHWSYDHLATADQKEPSAIIGQGRREKENTSDNKKQ
jgi:hypothetical protein